MPYFCCCCCREFAHTHRGCLLAFFQSFSSLKSRFLNQGFVLMISFDFTNDFMHFNMLFRSIHGCDQIWSVSLINICKSISCSCIRICFDSILQNDLYTFRYDFRSIYIYMISPFSKYIDIKVCISISWVCVLDSIQSRIGFDSCKRFLYDRFNNERYIYVYMIFETYVYV